MSDPPNCPCVLTVNYCPKSPKRSRTFLLWIVRRSEEYPGRKEDPRVYLKSYRRSTGITSRRVSGVGSGRETVRRLSPVGNLLHIVVLLFISHSKDVSIALIASFHKDGKWVWIHPRLLQIMEMWTDCYVASQALTPGNSCSVSSEEDLENGLEENKLGLLLCRGL